MTVEAGNATSFKSSVLPASPWPSAGVGWFVTTLLALGYVVSFLDRYLITLLVGPIKHDLNLSDTQIGLLQGLAFGVIYALAGLPIGWLVDRASRRVIVSVGVFGWTIAMFFCGLSTSFGALFAGRAGIGIGEATLSPAGLSLISDHFPPERRNRAISVFMLGASLGSGLSIIVGGTIVALASRNAAIRLPVLGEIKPWQLSFLIAGVPGFVIGALLLLVREPVRQGVATSVKEATGSFGAFLFERKLAFGLLIGGMALYAIAAYAFQSWLPTFFIRVFHWSPAKLAFQYGPGLIVCSGAGMLGAGFGADYLTKRGVASAPVLLMAIATLVSIVPAIFSTQLKAGEESLAFILFFNFLGAAPFGLSVSALMQITPNQFRGKIAALYLCIISVTGYGIGPVAVGLMNDMSRGNIKNSMSIVGALVVPLAAAALLLSIKPFSRARASAESWDPASSERLAKVSA